jgi:hypothetical protein
VEGRRRRGDRRGGHRAGPAHRFAGCRAEKNWSLIRYDIVCSLRAAFDVTGDETLRVTAQELIAHRGRRPLPEEVRRGVVSAHGTARV